MRKVGIICEYNPFHNGHAYQLREAGKRFRADAVICVMSGNYVQRGEPALVDKWSRAQWAVREGADLVLEMPTIWAAAGAPDFAEGAVRMLQAIGVDAISCGVETEDEKNMRLIAEILCRESESFRGALQEELKNGNSFARSREKAVRLELKRRGEREEAAQLLLSSNNILAIEYMRAARKLNWEVPFLLIPRKGAEHNSAEEKEGYLSASQIRRILRETSEENEPEMLPVPETVRRELMLKKQQKQLHPDASCFLDLLYYRISLMEPEQLREIEGMGEGLENALIRACSRYQSWETLVQQLTTLRYPASRIRRMLLNLCLGITREMVQTWKGKVPYLKVLCFNEAGQAVIREYQQSQKRKKKESQQGDEVKNSACSQDRETGIGPILLTNHGKGARLLEAEPEALLQQEARWSDLYALTLTSASDYERGREYRMNSIKIAK